MNTKLEFDHVSSVLCARMVSTDAATRRQAAIDAEAMLADLPKMLRNSPHCAGEIEALNTLIAKARGA